MVWGSKSSLTLDFADVRPTPLLHALSRLVGWLADRKVPTPLRSPLYSAYARATGADLSEARGPLTIYPSLGSFFIRRLVDGARTVSEDPRHLVSPVDGKVQEIGPITEGSILQAKGFNYPVRELLAGVGEDIELDGGTQWTLYLGPKDYHRIHTPEAGRLVEAKWVDGARYSVNPTVLARRLVFPRNERCVLRYETEHGPLLLVLVGAVNVGRIRVLGVEPGHAGPVDPAHFERGGELARFEMGSTIIIVAPPGGLHPTPLLGTGATVRLGQPIGRWW